MDKEKEIETQNNGNFEFCSNGGIVDASCFECHNKKKEVKTDKLAIQICRDCDSDWCRNRQGYCANAKKRAERWVNAGYGNIKQAVNEFAEKLKESFKNLSQEIKQAKSKDVVETSSKTGMIAALLRSEELVDNLVTELYGAGD